MKSTLKLIVAATLCAAVVYSCKTNVVKPTTTDNTSAVASQIALSLSKSFQGQDGGTSVNKGAKPYSITKKGPAINGIYDLCGTGIDTTYKPVTVIARDTTFITSGTMKFIYECGSAGVNGYNLDQTSTGEQGGATFYNKSVNTQSYIVKALDATYKLISIDGNIQTANHISTLAGTTTTEYHDLNSTYTFNGVTADVSGTVGDFLTGTASYTSVQTDYAARYGSASNVTNYHGIITYLGNHMATITLQINGVGAVTTYSVNMLTGALVQI